MYRLAKTNYSDNAVNDDDKLVTKIGGSPFIALPYGKGHFVFSTIQINKGDDKLLVKIIKEAKRLA